jgi:O-antigen/teichoic acid export membrane protein
VIAGRLLARNTLLNLAGQVLPAAAAIVATPILMRSIGEARFGILLLVWAAVGYFSLFDFGIGRALTHAVATRIGSRATHELSRVTWTALAMMLGLGVFGGVLVVLVTPFVTTHVLKIPVELTGEARAAFYLTAAVLPFMLLTDGFRGILEAFQDFGAATALRLPLATLSYFAPVLVLPFSRNLAVVVAALLAVRLAGSIAHAWVCIRRYEFLQGTIDTDRSLVRPLLGFGGWMTVSNIISPLMVNLDRFMIAAALTVNAVTYYATPYEAASRLWLIPAALMGVLFPAFAAVYVSDRARTVRLLDRAVRVIIAAVFPPALVLVAFAHEGMTLWIGAAFAQHSAAILQWLVAGIFVNSAAQVAYTAVQGTGRPDLTAKLHLVELPLYVAAFWILTKSFGLIGAVIAWDLRIVFDLVVLFWMAGRQLPEARAALAKAASALVVLSGLLAIAGLMSTTTTRVAAVVGGSLVFAGLCWTSLIRAPERALLIGWLRRAPAVPTVPAPAAELQDSLTAPLG